MVNNILIEVLGTIAQQERETICKRQAEGIEAAKAKGKKFGRPALAFPPNWDKVYASWKAGEITAKTAMELTATKRTSFYKLVSIMSTEKKYSEDKRNGKHLSFITYE
jgi:DNA invertase Pin-like site-specific DNA recombinase